MFVSRRCEAPRIPHLAHSRCSITRERTVSTNHKTAIIAAAAPASSPPTLAVKICGITTAEDATLAATAGATYVGLIAWPKAKRGVPVPVAREIAEAARQHGAAPVAVFVDETASQIAEFCSAAGIDLAQLHGDAARVQLPFLPAWLRVVYVAHAAADGELKTVSPSECCAQGTGRNRL